jgi:F0F1-type ATP synthase assembly protein I
VGSKRGLRLVTKGALWMPDDDRLPLAKAYQRATRVVTVAAGMVLPGLLGYWADSRLGTGALLTIAGFALGMTYGLYDLVRLGQATSQRKSADKKDASKGD